MHLSRLTLDPSHHAVRRDLADPYQMHRTLTHAFADDALSRPERFLWRVESIDPTAQATRPIVLVQSESPGNWPAIEAHARYFLEPPEAKAVDLARLVVQGAQLRFRLRANPTRFSGGKRWGLFREDEQLAWLERKAEQGGFALDHAAVHGRERVSVQQNRTGQRMTFDCAQFEGVLHVVDPVRSLAAISGGIGAAKSMGFGLLSVAPVDTRA